MTETIVRDIDIVSGNVTESGASQIRSEALNPLTGKPFTKVVTTGVLSGSMARNDNTLIILEGAAKLPETEFTLGGGQALVGGGTHIELRTASGRALTFKAPGSAGTIEGSGRAITVTKDNMVAGLTFTGDIQITGDPRGTTLLAGNSFAQSGTRTIIDFKGTEPAGERSILIQDNRFDGSGTALSAIATELAGPLRFTFERNRMAGFSGTAVSAAVHKDSTVILAGNTATGVLQGFSVAAWDRADIAISGNVIEATNTGMALFNYSAPRETVLSFGSNRFEADALGLYVGGTDMTVNKTGTSRIRGPEDIRIFGGCLQCLSLDDE